MKWPDTFLKKKKISHVKFYKRFFQRFSNYFYVDGRTDQTEEKQVEEQKDFPNMNAPKTNFLAFNR